MKKSHASRRSSRPSARSGMTLLEVLIVTVLLTFLAFATFQSVRSTIRVKEEIDQKTEMLQESRAALAVMDRDLRSAFYLTAHDLGWAPVQTQPDEPKPSIPVPVTIFKGESRYLFFSANSHQRMSADSPENEQHFVTYQLNQDELIRAESVRALSIKDRESSATADYKQFALLNKVKKVTFSFWDTKTDQWTDAWDTEKPENLDTLPGAVKIEIEYQPEIASGRRRIDETVKLSTAVRIVQTAFKTGSRNPAVAANAKANPTAAPGTVPTGAISGGP